MTPHQRYFDDVTSTIEEIGDSLFEQARRRATPLFRWVASRVLLGQLPTEAEPLFEEQVASFAWSGDPNVDLGKWTTLTGVAVVLNRDPAELARALIARLPSYQALRETDYQICQCVLSLSMLAGNDALIERWSRACYGVRPDSAAPYTFEVLALAALAWRHPDADLDVAADTAARMIRGDMLYTTAPQVCALQALAARAGAKASALLFGRLQRLDDLAFGSADQPKVTVGPPTSAYVEASGQGPGGAALEITVHAKGHGELIIGPYDIAPLTHGLYEVIVAAIDKADHARLAHRAAQQLLRDQALRKPSGACHGVLDLGTGVEMSPRDVRRLEERFLLGFAIAKHQIGDLAASPRLTVRRQSPMASRVD
jgi:hypothetical protein